MDPLEENLSQSHLIQLNYINSKLDTRNPLSFEENLQSQTLSESTQHFSCQFCTRIQMLTKGNLFQPDRHTIQTLEMEISHRKYCAVLTGYAGQFYRDKLFPYNHQLFLPKEKCKHLLELIKKKTIVPTQIPLEKKYTIHAMDR